MRTSQQSLTDFKFESMEFNQSVDQINQSEHSMISDLDSQHHELDICQIQAASFIMLA